MEIKGKMNLFVEVKGKGEETFKVFSTSVSNKDKDGKYTNLSLQVNFAGEKFPKEKTDKLEEGFCYTLDIKSGFITCRTFQAKDGSTQKRVCLVITDAKIESKKKINKKAKDTEDDLPF